MSSPIPAAEAATGVPLTDAQRKAGEEVEDKTPDALVPEPPPEDDPIPDPTEGGEALDTASDLMSKLAGRVEVLEDTVKGLQTPDEPVVKRKPWTQRGGRKR